MLTTIQDLSILKYQLQSQNQYNFDYLIDLLNIHFKISSFQLFKQNRYYSKRKYRFLVIKKYKKSNPNKISDTTYLIRSYFYGNYFFKEYYIQKVNKYIIQNQQQIYVQVNEELNQSQLKIKMANQSENNDLEEKQQSYQLVEKINIFQKSKDSFILIPSLFNTDVKVNSQLLHFLKNQCKVNGKSEFANDLQNFSQLKSISFNFYKVKIDEKFSEQLSTSIKQLSNISEFKLNNSNSSTPSSSFTRIISRLSYQNNLNILQFDFSNCFNLNSKIFSDIAHLISRQPQLYHFYINLQSWNSRCKHKILSEKHSFIYALRNCKDLKILFINLKQQMQGLNIELKYLGKTLSQCSQIDDLSLFFSKSEDDEEDYIQSIANGFKKLQNLTKLQLSIGQYNVNKLIELIIQFPNLKQIKSELASSFYDRRYFYQNIQKVEEIDLEFFKRKIDKNKMTLKFDGEFVNLFEASQYKNEIQNINHLRLGICDLNININEIQKALDFINLFTNLQNLEFLLCPILDFNNFDLNLFDQCKNLRYAKIYYVLPHSRNMISKLFFQKILKSNKQLVLFELCQNKQFHSIL